MSLVLVVEDDPAILHGLQESLRLERYDVLSASDGETGYRLAREKKPDLLILDLMLPKMGGFEVCRKLRSEKFVAPILILTARGEESDRVLGLDLGADDYVTKPFGVDELLARVRAALRRSGADAEIEVFDAGDFRMDLFHRLSVVNLRIPALRERKADILPLARAFLEKYGREMHRQVRGFTPEAQALLLEHPWPGNVRELKNAMERTVLMSDKEWVSPDDISLFEVRSSAAPLASHSLSTPSGLDLEGMERQAVLEALQRANWVQKDAAAALGISSRVMNYKIKKYNFTNPRWSRNKPPSDN